MNSLNIIQFILEYSNTLLFLYLEKHKQNRTHAYEYDDFIKSLFNNADNTCSTNKYGNTRCYTTTEIINLVFGINEPNKKIEQNADIKDVKNKINNYVQENKLIKISIEPDHIFYILRTPNDESFLISSWIYLYKLNIIKINFDEFMADFLELFYKDKINDINYDKYESFLSKYFFYKSNVKKNSLFIINDINSLRESLKSLHINDIIYTDYYGHGGKHILEFEFYDINYHNISFLLSGFLTNVVVFCTKHFEEINGDMTQKNIMIHLITNWLKTEAINYVKQDDNEYFNAQISILAQSIFELIDFADNGNHLSYDNINNDDYLYAGKENALTKFYVKKIFEKINNNLSIDIIGGKISRKIEQINTHINNTFFEYIFKYWIILSKKYNLADFLIADKIYENNNISIKNMKDYISSNNYDNVYRIHYLQNNKEKMSYIVTQKNTYSNGKTSPSYLFIDNENEIYYNNENSSRLIFINFNINTLQELLLQRYVIIGNTFYRETADTITLIKFEIFERNKDAQNLHEKIDNALNQYFDIYSSISNRNVLSHYDSFAKTLMINVENNKNKFIKLFFREVDTFSDVFIYIGRQNHNVIKNLDNMYYPFNDPHLEINNSFKIYESIKNIV